MKLTDVFDAVQSRLEIDLKETRSAIEHAASKGSVNEETVRSLLRSRLPRTVEISHGFLMDAQGNVSRQLDVIIHDAAKTPVLFESNQLRVIPVECAYAVMEVKTSLTLDEVDSCWTNMCSVKAMAKSAFYDEGQVLRPTVAYGSEYRDWPVMYFVFAFDSAPLKSVAARLSALTAEKSAAIDKRIDSIFTVQRGLLTNFNGYVNALPQPDSHLVGIKQDAFVMFYALLSHYMNQVYMRSFNFKPYLAQHSWDIENYN